MKGLSSKEIKIVSYLELEEKIFFRRKDIKQFFKNTNEMNVYIHRLRKKGRIIKINRTKYYLIPVKAFENYWSEHSFIVVDEIFNGKNYYIGGMAAAYYYKLIEQIPTKITVFCKSRQGAQKIFNFTIIYKRRKSLKPYIIKKIKDHPFNIVPKTEIIKWLKR